MKELTFPGGVHPPYSKDISIREPLREAPLPSVAVVPLSQHIGSPNQAVVSKGDVVEEGQLIGSSPAFISAPVHSPISGTVKEIRKAFHPALGPVMSVVIERDKSKEAKDYTQEDVDAEALSPEQIIEKVKDAGIVGMGGAAFPTHVKLNVPEGKKIDTFIVNGAECEPYLTCDHVLMTRKTQEILKGIELIAKVLKPKDIYIGIENNKKAAFFAFQKAIKKATRKVLSDIHLVPLHTKYPQGGEKQLIQAISGREVPPGKLPLDIGFLVQNVGTINAVYEAVHMRKPLIERVVTISGDCINRPGNYLIRVGATIKDIIEQYGIELYRDPEKVIVGGPMMGFAQPTLEVSVLKSTSGILFLSENLAKTPPEEKCIRCAKCVDVCPVRLLPTELMNNVKNGNWPEVRELNVADCIECGSCAYICPSRIPLIQYIKEGKEVLVRKKMR
ncbi:MAG: electron transport complex subunit RsxC [Candidatus Omnitrophica bacterium]|nr:electron transport complex subunit RsxC [Candidatus Omnitrophota bacterium]